MAVSCLSPVRIQILMSAFIRVSMVSGTLSWSLSSIAVAPSSCRFYTKKKKCQQEVIITEEGLWNVMCQRNMWAGIVSLTQPCFSLHQLLLFINHKNRHRLWNQRTQSLSNQFSHQHTHKILLVFPRKPGGFKELVVGSYGTVMGRETWQDPGAVHRQEPAAEKKAGEAF